MNTVYRKMQNGKEFMKIMDGVHALSVLSSTVNKKEQYRIQYVQNQIMIQDYKDDHISMPSSKEEFEAVYKEAGRIMKSFFEVE